QPGPLRAAPRTPSRIRGRPGIGAGAGFRRPPRSHVVGDIRYTYFRMSAISPSTWTILLRLMLQNSWYTPTYWAFTSSVAARLATLAGSFTVLLKLQRMARPGGLPPM